MVWSQSDQSHVRYILSVHPARYIPVNHIHHLAQISIIRQPLPVIHAQDFHPFVIHQIRQQLGGVIRKYWALSALHVTLTIELCTTRSAR